MHVFIYVSITRMYYTYIRMYVNRLRHLLLLLYLFLLLLKLQYQHHLLLLIFQQYIHITS